MRLCTQCKMRQYCSTDCQKSDWGRHKTECEVQAAKMEADVHLHPGLAEDYDTWRTAMGPMLPTWLCVHGLAVHDHPEHIQTKFVLLGLQEKSERPDTPLKMFKYKSITVLDRSCLAQLFGPSTAPEMIELIGHSDEEAKAQGKAGAAMLVVCVTPPDGKTHVSKFLRLNPVLLRMEELLQKPLVGWKNHMKNLINEGKNLKRAVAKQEKRGEIFLGEGGVVQQRLKNRNFDLSS
ncbi:hypothetical protein B0H19DRAFT_1376464 [Mycena capillaripes]|nr:hypothetical protein B0H19DRAFT_1376464 [Mycena capillaripes]